MKVKPLPLVEFLDECFEYEASTGKLYWKRRPLEHFERPREFPAYSAQRECKRWNTRYAGQEVGVPSDDGHLHVRLQGTSYFVHRVIWKLVTRMEPPELLDHRDQIPDNNRFRNLRPASESQNQINRSNGWGAAKARGIRFQRGRWYARVHKNRECIHVGGFATKEEAVAARSVELKRLYGEFAPT